MEPLGRRAKAESEPWRSEAETGDPPTTVELETDRPEANPLHIWRAKDELKNWQDAAALALHYFIHCRVL